jgi:cbb3-type cytochrome oxidase subunit 3
MPKPSLTQRRHDLDWLRVIAFGVLIYFHAAVAFLPQGIPMTINDTASIPLELMVVFFSQWRLALLFFVSGCGVHFALRKRDRSSFFRERSVRLLVPLLVGIILIVPPIVYLEKQFIGEFAGTFVEFYPQFFSNGIYPSGNLSWHHFWFIAYLYLFCVCGWPALRWLKGARGQAAVSSWVKKWLSPGGIYLLILPLILIELPLRALFPGFRDLIHDWASIFHWFIIFLAGYAFANFPALLESANRHKWFSLGLAAITSLLLIILYWQPHSNGLSPVFNGQISIPHYVLFVILRMITVWAWILSCVGIAAYCLNRPSATLRYLNQAVYPFYCIHLLVLVGIEVWVLPLDWSIVAKYLSITSLAIVITLLAYELIRRAFVLRLMFGLKPNN